MTKRGKRTALLQRTEQIAELQRENERLKAKLAEYEEEGGVPRQGPEPSRASVVSSVDAFTTCDSHLTVTDVDEAALRYFGQGLGKKDVIGKNLADLTADKDRCERYLKVVETGERFVAEESLVLPEIGEVRVVTRVFRVGDGLGILTSDITTQKRAEDEGRHSQELLRSFMDSATDGFTIYDSHLNLVDVNETALRYLGPGLRREDVVGKNLADFIPDWERHAPILKVMETGEPATTEETFVLPTVGEFSVITRTFKVGEGIGIVTSDITARKRMEKDLGESEEKFKALVENSTAVVFSLDTQGNILYISPVIAQMTGFTPSEVIGTSFAQYIVPEDLPGLMSSFERTLAGQREPYEFRAKQKDGSIRHVLTSSQPIHRDGKLAGLIGVMVDITARKRAEEALRASEGKFRVLAETTPAAIMLYQDDKWVYANPAAVEICGYTAEELLSMNYWDIVHPDYRQLITERGQKRQRGLPSTPRYEFKIISKGGKEKWVDLAGASIEFRGKGAGIISVLDITDRKRAEEELRMSEERFRILHEASFGGIGIHDKGVILDCNQGLADMTGYTLDELIGMDGLGLIAPAWRDHVMEKILGGYEKPYEVEGLRKDGSIYPLQIQGKNIPYHGRRVRVTEFRDITERKRAEERLRRQERYFRAITEHSSDVVIVLDKNGTVRYVSPNIESMLGVTREQTLGGSLGDSVHPDDMQTLVSAWRHLLESPGVTSHIELRAKHSDGSWRYVEAVGHNLLLDPAVEGVVIDMRDVTERREAEEKLRRSEERFRQITENMLDAVSLVDGKGIIQYVSPSHQRILGYRSEDLVGKGALDFIHPDDVDDVLSQFDEIAKRGGKIGYQYRFRHSDGHYVWAESSARALLDDKGGVTGIVFGTRDITERRRAEQEVRMLSSVVEQSTEGMAIAALDGTLTFVNDAWCRMHGYENSNELLGRNLAVFHSEEQFENDVKPFNQKVIELGSWRGEVGHVTRDGKPFPTLMATTLLKDDRGNPYALAGIARDITERKEAERALSVSEERYRMFAENASDALWIMDMNLNLTYHSGGDRIFGYTAEEMLKRPVDQRMTPESVQTAFKILQEELAIEQLLDKDLNRKRVLEVAQYHKNGSIIHTEETVSFLRDENGKAIGITGVTRDITERKKAEEALRASKESYRLLVEKATEGIMVIQDWTVRFVNPKVVEVSDYATEEMVFKPFLDFIHPDDRQMVAEHHARRLRGEETPRLYQCRLLGKAGNTIWVEVSGVLLDWEGRPAVLALLNDITERKRAEEAVRESGERYRALYEDNPSMYFTVDPAGTVLSVNQFGCEELGYTAQELLGQSVLKVFHDEDKAAAARSVALCVENPGQVFHWELRKVQKSGSVMWVKETARAVRGTDGKITVFIVCEDITKRKRAEETLKVSEERYRLLFHRSPVGVFHYDTQLRITDCNSRFEAVLQSSRERLVGLDLKTLKDQSVLPALRQALEGKEGSYEGFYRATTSSSELWISMHTAPLFDQQGKVSGAVAIVEDVTERKRAEKRVEESERQYRLLAENASDVIWVTDMNLRPLYLSPSITQFLGYSIDEAMSRTIGESLTPLSLDAAMQALASAVSEGNEELGPDLPPRRLELLFKRKDGSQVWADTSVSVIRGPDGRPIQIMGVLRDVTERKRAEEELRRAHAELEARVEQRTAELQKANALLLQEIRQRQQAQDKRQETESKYRELVENANSIILELDTSGKVSFLNRFAQEFFGFSEAEIVGRHAVGTIIPPTDSEGNDLRVKIKDLTKHPEDHYTSESEGIRQDGKRVWIGWTNQGLYDKKGRLLRILCIGMDRTEQRQVAAMLAQQEKEKAAAAERQRLARDLHDAVTQTLFSASLIAEVLPQLWEKDHAEGRHRLEELRRLTRGALAEMRMLLLELRPAALGEVGLVDLLRQLSEATTGRTTLPVAFTSRGQCTAPIDVQVALYRVAQEALNNVAKHSGATKASISLHCRENSADLTISDNGSGFDLQTVSPMSLGLRIMRERAEAAGAKLKIESQAGLGTKVGVLWSDATRKGGS